MRISDWSSDVCSSDLVVTPPDDVAVFLSTGGYLPLGVPLIKPVAALPGQHVCRNGVAITIDGKPVGAAREQDRMHRPLPVWEGCRVVAPDEIFFMNADRSDSLDGRYFGRSEEHTSELQSLMRISYAVLCFKKT